MKNRHFSFLGDVSPHCGGNVNESQPDMSAEVKEEIDLEIGHLSFGDIVDYSKLSSAAQELKIVLAI